MSTNKRAKERLIALYGEKDFLDAMGIKLFDTPRKYTSKKQMKRMRQLSYHHIVPKSVGR